ncbi:MAG: DUF1587 domain-containing protein, partial [Aureliella sp.]
MFSRRRALPQQALQFPTDIRFQVVALGLSIAALINLTTPSLAVESTVEAPPRPNVWRSDVQPFLQQYCYDCHSGPDAESDIDFEAYDTPDQLAHERARWEQVRGMIEIGAMPPADYSPLPTIEERQKVARWLKRTINDVDCGGQADPGRVTMRRLNNVEYDNAIRDLLGVDNSFSSQVGFPSDGVGNGFDNQGEVLSLSPLQFEKYLQAAKLVTSQLIIDDPETLRKQQYDLPHLYAGDRESVQFLFATGAYEIKARLKFEDDKEENKIPVALLVDGEEVERFEVGKEQHTFRLDHDFTAGEHELTLHFVEDPYSEKKRFQRRIDVEYVEIEGPRDASPALPLSHRRLFTSHPAQDKSLEQAADEILRPLLRRAFRRNVEELEVQRVVNLVKLASEQGESYQQAIGFGLQSILVSPHFLFRVEGDDNLQVALSESSSQSQDQSYSPS